MRKLWDEREEQVAARPSRPAARRSSTVDKTPFQAAMKPVYDKFITDPKLKDLVKRSRTRK